MEKASFAFVFCMVIVPMTICRPMVNDQESSIDHHLINDEAESIYERLKVGDVEAWRQYGSEVVDVVYKMVEQGQADDPFDALLMLFYPNLTPEERRETLVKFEPLLQKLLEQPMDENADSELDQDLTLYKKRSQPQISPKKGFGDNERLQNALKQLKMESEDPVDSLPEKQAQKNEGQKEKPLYLGTHESPEGISWRG